MAKGMKQQAAIAMNKKKRMMATKSSAGKYKVGAMFKKHNMDQNRDGKIDKKDFKIMRAQQKTRKMKK